MTRRRGRPPKVDHRDQLSIDGLPSGPGPPSTGDEGEPLGSAVGLEFTTDALAQLYGVSSQQVRKWTTQGLPKVGRNRYLLTEVVAWRESRRDRREAATEQAEDARRELLTEQAEGHRIRNQMRRGELAPASDIVTVLTEVLRSAIALLEAAPLEITDDPAEQAHLRELTDGIREHLARELGRVVERAASRAARRTAAAETARRSVGRPAEVATRG